MQRLAAQPRRLPFLLELLENSLRTPVDNTIYVANHSSQVTDAQVQAMTAACAKQIAQHVAPAHYVLPAPVLYLARNAPALPTQARIITVMDDLDDPQALGYHTEDGADHIWGVVGTKAAMSQGAKALTGAYSISSILSHEVGEMFMDPFCSGWYDSGKGYLVAAEIGDPVQSDFYLIDGVAVSNFVCGAWFNPMAAKTDKFDWMGNLKAPFTMSRGGYWVQLKGGKVTQKFGTQMPKWLREVKMSSESRTQRIGVGPKL
jgi:hypothetical protein